MSMYYRCKETGNAMSIPYTSVFKNVSPKDSHKRMLTFNLGIPEESYIVLDRVNVAHVCGTKNLAKVCITNLSDRVWDSMRAFHKCITNMYPQMSVDPLDHRSLKIVLKKKWYRAYDTNGIEIVPSEDIVEKLLNDHKKGGQTMSFQIHVNVIRTHNERILFQPMVRKVYLH